MDADSSRPEPDCDVVVVGAGNAALCAAISARELGADVLVVEAAPREQRGGNSRFTDGAIRLAHRGLADLRALMPGLSNDEAARVDIDAYPPERYLADLVRLSGGRTDRTLARRLAEDSYDTLRWMLGHGVAFELILDNQAVRECGRHRFWGGLVLRASGRGVGLMEGLFERADHLGIRVRYGSAASGLVTESGRVTGVRLDARDRGVRRADHTIEARDARDADGARIGCGALVLACGGFEASPELRARHLGTQWGDVIVRGTPHNTGSGLTMALDAGASACGDWGGCHGVAMDEGAPSFGDFEIGGDVFKKHSYPYGIVVNRNGRRFLDEGADFRNYTYAHYGRALLDQPGGVAFQIFDDQVADLLRSEYAGPHCTGFEASTLEELAALLDIDEHEFLGTVIRFNRAVQEGSYRPHALDGKGTLGLTPPKSNWALRIEKPPFRAFPVRCGITFTYGGLRVSENAAVLDGAGVPISGLFAAGEMVGGLFYDNYPGGAGLASGAVFGRIAGASAAEAAREGAA